MLLDHYCWSVIYRCPESKEEDVFFLLKGEMFLVRHSFHHCAEYKRLLRLCFGRYSVFRDMFDFEDMNGCLLESQLLFSNSFPFSSDNQRKLRRTTVCIWNACSTMPRPSQDSYAHNYCFTVSTSPGFVWPQILDPHKHWGGMQTPHRKNKNKSSSYWPSWVNASLCVYMSRYECNYVNIWHITVVESYAQNE